MANRLESQTVFKHQQHLKLQREGEEESWISGEELRTDGSSDEDNHKKLKMNKKNLLRRKSSEKNISLSHVPTFKMTKKSKPEIPLAGSSTSKDLTEEEPVANLQEIPLNWRPKRGSLKLPNLFEDNFENQDVTEILYIEENMHKFGLHKYLPIIKSETHMIFNTYNKKIVSMISSTENFERRITENTKLLEIEKSERLKTQEELMGLEIYSRRDFNDKNASSFPNLCYFAEKLNPIDKVKENVQNFNEKSQQKTEQNTKNFIQRNIELAAAAMSRLALTDKEKEKLNQILADIDLSHSNEKPVASSSNFQVRSKMQIKEENSYEKNGFWISKEDRQRMCEIDNELQNYTETQNLKLPDMDEQNNFWKSLVLDQKLKDIDKKLADIKREDENESNTDCKDNTIANSKCTNDNNIETL